MAVPGKGWRKISVEGSVYHWRANGQDWGIEVIVVTEGAFHRGDRAQQLAFTLDYDHLQTPREAGGFALKQRAAVAPEVIRLAIERALSAEPPFRGIAGAADVSLSPQAVAELQVRARIDS